MKDVSRYKYEKRIKDLELEIQSLKPFRQFAYNLNTTIAEVVTKKESLNTGWIIAQYGSLLK